MADTEDSFNVQRIQGIDGMRGLGQPLYNEERKKDGRHKDAVLKKPQDYMKTISNAAKSSNEKLIKAKLPYRFCIYTEDNEMFIDVVVLDKNGIIITETKKNISQQAFEQLIEDISQIEGLFVDRTA